jgi:hypothetical protein
MPVSKFKWVMNEACLFDENIMVMKAVGPRFFCWKLVGQQYWGVKPWFCVGTFHLPRCWLGFLWLSLHDQLRVRQNRFCPSLVSASLVGAFVVKYSKIIKTTWVSSNPYKSEAIVCAYCVCPTCSYSKPMLKVLLLTLLSNCDCWRLFVVSGADFISVCSYSPRSHLQR